MHGQCLRGLSNGQPPTDIPGASGGSNGIQGCLAGNGRPVWQQGGAGRQLRYSLLLKVKVSYEQMTSYYGDSSNPALFIISSFLMIGFGHKK